MIKKTTRWFLPALLGVLMVFMLVAPVLAIADPSSLSVNAVYAYRNCREDGDQLYLIDYTITYGSNPSETVTEAFLCRLMDGTTELRAVAPYAYYDDGYGRGVASIYFTAADAPTWEGSYTMQLAGNPVLDWAGAPPSATLSTFDVWQDNEISITQVVVSSRIITLATTLESAWGIDMVEQDADTGEYTLTVYGEAYFSGAISYLSDVAPDIYEGLMPSEAVEPEIDEVDTSTDYADDLESDIIGTTFDITPMATEFGVSRGILTALLYYGVVAFALIKISSKLESQKPIMLLSIPLVILGAFIGVPLIVTILAGLVSVFYIAYSIFYKPSTA